MTVLYSPSSKSDREGAVMWETLYEQFRVAFAGWSETIIENLPRIAGAIVVLAIAATLNGRAQRAVERFVAARDGQRELARLLGRMTRIGLIAVTLIIVLSLLNLTGIVAPFIASLGIAGLIVAFALQDITKNFAAGVLLLLLRPFRLDDRIRVRDFEGVVTDITLRATSLRSADGTEVLVPNADVYSSPIVNLTRYPRRRYVVPLALPVAVPAEPARQRLEALLRSLPQLESDPAPDVVITATTVDAVTLEARYWLPSRALDAPQTQTDVIGRLQALIERFKAQVAQVDQPA